MNIGVRVTAARDRSIELVECFDKKDNIYYCKDIPTLFKKMNQDFVVAEWRLFIDGNKRSIKVVLLHNGNTKPSIPIAYAVNIKESYDTMKEIIALIQYRRFNFKIVADYKVIAFLMGLQSGYTKYCCYLCLWDSRADKLHYKQKEWPRRNEYTPGKDNVKGIPLVDADCIIPPPLHIKLGLFKNFVKALEKDGPAFQHLISFFPRLSNEKIRQGVFDGPQIRELLKDDEFNMHLAKKELDAYKAFIAVVEGFLGNHRAKNAKKLVDNLLKKYEEVGARMSLKIHFLKSHFNTFPDNLGQFSDEQGERFHQDMRVMEQRFSGRFHKSMLGEYCWNLLRSSNFPYSRKSLLVHF